MALFGRRDERARQKRRRRATGGDYLRGHLDSAAGGPPVAVFEEEAWSDQVSVAIYRVDEPVPHFLFATLGLSRTSSSQPVAGTQTELTLRVPATDSDAQPPTWPVQRLQRLARFLKESDEPVDPGHYMDLRAPVCAGAALTGFIFVNDPIIGLCQSPLGLVRFIYAVSVTSDELDAALAWDPLKFAGVLGDAHPLGLSNPHRASILTIPATSKPIAEATREEGSSISAVATSYLSVDSSGRIDITAHAAEQILRAMRHRLAHGRHFAVVSSDAWVYFTAENGTGPREQTLEKAVDYADNSATIRVSRNLRHEILASLDSAPGTYRMTSEPLAFHVFDPDR